VLAYAFQFNGTRVFSPAARFDTTIVNADGDTNRVAWDHSAGRVEIAAVGRVWLGARMEDQLELIDVPSGTQVSATLELDVGAHILNSCGGGGCGVRFHTSLAAAGDSVAVEGDLLGPCDGCTRDIVTRLSLPVVFRQGEPVSIAVSVLHAVTNVGWGTSTASATYQVTGLPIGARVMRCSAERATTQLPHSWGAMKALYR
jgi:hypothetical protein